jgi:hypothetical protein
VGKENTSSGHVADSNISKLRKGSRLTENNKRHSSDDACKVSKSLGFGLHETSETRVNQDSVPVSEVCLLMSIFLFNQRQCHLFRSLRVLGRLEQHRLQNFSNVAILISFPPCYWQRVCYTGKVIHLIKNISELHR